MNGFEMVSLAFRGESERGFGLQAEGFNLLLSKVAMVAASLGLLFKP